MIPGEYEEAYLDSGLDVPPPSDADLPPGSPVDEAAPWDPPTDAFGFALDHTMPPDYESALPWGRTLTRDEERRRAEKRRHNSERWKPPEGATSPVERRFEPVVSFFTTIGFDVDELATPREHLLAQRFAFAFGGYPYDAGRVAEVFWQALEGLRGGWAVEVPNVLPKGRQGAWRALQGAVDKLVSQEEPPLGHEDPRATYACLRCRDRGTILGVRYTAEREYVESYLPCPDCNLGGYRLFQKGYYRPEGDPSRPRYQPDDWAKVASGEKP